MRLDIRGLLCDLPITRRFVRSPMVPFPAIYHYIVRHATFSTWYWRDPYGYRAQYGDPRSDWGPRDKAHRFRSEEEAAERLAESGYRGQIIRLTVREEVLP